MEAVSRRWPPTSPRLAELAYQLGLCSFVLGTAVRSGEQGHLDAATTRRQTLSAQLRELLGIDL
jgi:hypothetical protein